MAPRTSDRGGFLLRPFGLSLGMAILVTASACTTSNAPRSGAPATGVAVAGGAGAVPGEGGSRGADREVWLAPPVTPAAIAVPAGAVVTAHFRGVGAQVYVCAAASAKVATPTTTPPPTPAAATGQAASTFAWTLKAPDARLLDGSGAEVGAHTTGPTWTSSVDGSAVVGAKIAQVDAPVGTAIPWLLLRGTTHSGTGTFSSVTFVQRVGTVSGKAPPASACDQAAAGAEVRVEYSAEYYFFTGGA